MSQAARHRFLLPGAGWIAALILGSLPAAALDGPAAYVLDFPVQQNLATPAWLGHPLTPASTFATVEIPIVPPDAAASLLVTATFDEKAGDFLRVSWQADQGAAQTLSENLEEGVAMANQRTLLVSPDTLNGSGTLSFQSGDAATALTHLKLEWVETKNALISPEVQELLVTSQDGVTQPASALDGQPPVAGDGSWHGKIVDVPLTDTPQRIEQGVDFSVQLNAVPKAARLVVDENGLPLNQHLVVWINGKRAGLISPAVPSLDDIGFAAAPDSTSFVGWRRGSLLVPASLLPAGPAAIQFSTEPDDLAAAAEADPTAAAAPLAVKNVVLQMAYDDPSDATTTAIPETNAPASAPPADASITNAPADAEPLTNAAAAAPVTP